MRRTHAWPVVKTRASAHDPRIREFEITSEGIGLGDEFALGQSLQ